MASVEITGSDVSMVESEMPPAALKVLDFVWVVVAILATSFSIMLGFYLYLRQQGYGALAAEVYFGSQEGLGYLSLIDLATKFCVIVLLISFFAWRRGVSFSGLGFTRAKARYYWYVLPGFALILGFSWAAASFLDISAQNELARANDVLVEQSGTLLFAILIFIVLLTPFAEELFFRAGLFGALRRHMPAVLAAVVSASLFSVLHVQYLLLGGVAAIVGVSQMFFMALVLTWFYVRSGSIWPPVLLHVLNNALALAVLFSQVDPQAGLTLGTTP